jgi:hypothetical protein
MTTTHEVRNGIVYKKDTFDDGTWAEVALQAFVVLEIIGDNAVGVDTDLPLTVIAKDWQGNNLSIDGTITVTAKNREIESSITAEMVAGSATFTFNSGLAGQFILEVSLNGVATTPRPQGVTVNE